MNSWLVVSRRIVNLKEISLLPALAVVVVAILLFSYYNKDFTFFS